MATVLGVNLIYIFILGTFIFVHCQGILKQYRICEGKDAKLIFDKVPGNKTSSAEWYKMSQNRYNSTCILKKHKVPRPCIAYQGKASLTTDNHLKIARIDRSDTGVYLQELHTNNGDKEPSSYLQVTVSVPPSDLPHINATQLSDGKLRLTCYEPEYKGYPPARTQLQDSNGRPQNELVVTVSDNMYKCCLIGVAVSCMDQHNDGCSTYTIKDSEKDYCISCWILIYLFGLIPWSLLPIKTLYQRKKCGKRKNEKFVYTIMLFIASLVITILLPVYFCLETDDCISISILGVVVGFITSIIFVAWLEIKEKLSENKRLQKYILNKLMEKTVENNDKREQEMHGSNPSGIPVSEADIGNDDRDIVLHLKQGQDKNKTGEMTPTEPKDECQEQLLPPQQLSTQTEERLDGLETGSAGPEADIGNDDRDNALDNWQGQDKNKTGEMTPTKPTEDECQENSHEKQQLLPPQQPSTQTEERLDGLETGSAGPEDRDIDLQLKQGQDKIKTGEMTPTEPKDECQENSREKQQLLPPQQPYMDTIRKEESDSNSSDSNERSIHIIHQRDAILPIKE